MTDCKCTTAEAFPMPSGHGWTGQYSKNQGWVSNRYSFKHGRTSPSPFFPMTTPAPEFNDQAMPTYQDVANALSTNELYDMDPIFDGQLGALTQTDCERQNKTLGPMGLECVDLPVAYSTQKNETSTGVFWGLLAGVAIGALLFKK